MYVCFGKHCNGQQKLNQINSLAERSSVGVEPSNRLRVRATECEQYRSFHSSTGVVHRYDGWTFLTNHVSDILVIKIILVLVIVSFFLIILVII